MPRAASKPEPTNERLVVLLRKSERRRLEQLAAAEHVSAAEIVRRSLGTYETIEARIRKQHEEELLESAVAMLSRELASVNESIEHTCEKLDALHLKLQQREVA
jgi:RNA polymerase-interacting CarD/CdnL/TRCF family regulator